MNKRVICLILAFVIVFPILCSAKETPYTANSGIYQTLKNISFTDVEEKAVDHWSKTAIYVMASIGAIKGYDGFFDMNSPVKNHEAFAVLFRCINKELEAEKLKASVADFKVQNPGVYNDLDSWADGYMRLAVDYNLISVNEFLSCMEIEYLTNPNPFFRKEANALRGDLAKWMVIVFGLEKAEKENMIIDFYDYDTIKEEDKLYIETALNYGIIKGADGYINPYSTLTREEMAQMFFNSYKLWANAGGYEIFEDTISDITVDTHKNANGDKLENVKTITMGENKVQTKITYNLNGEVVDSTIYPYNEYVDFPVIRERQVPNDSSVLQIGDTVTLLAKDNTVVCSFETKGEEDIIKVDTSQYETSKVYVGKLYCYDADDKTLVIENSEGEYEEIPLFPGAEFYERENLIEKKDINAKYCDKEVYVFTVRKMGTPSDRGYRVQIL